MPDEDDRPRDASSAAGAGWSDPDALDTSWADAVAPDDISELGKDVAAYRRERRAQRRHAAVDRYVGRPGAPILTVLLAVLAVAAITATLLTVVRPSHGATKQTELPLAKTSAVGGIGGLLPAATLTNKAGSSVPASSLRPAVFALTTPTCADCVGTVTQLAKDTAADSESRIPFYAVVPTAVGQSALGDVLSDQLPSGDAIYYDAQKTLLKHVNNVPLTGVTLVFVDRNGTIAKVLPNVTTTSAGTLQTTLVSMLFGPTD